MSTWAVAGVALLVLLPLAALLAVAIPFVLGSALRETTVHRWVRGALWGQLSIALILAAGVAISGTQVGVIGQWYGDAEYALDLAIRLDPLAAGAGLLVAAVSLVVLRFSENYLHKEPGHLRFFATGLLAVSCLDVIVLAGTLDVLFAGWELLGLCSFLLIAFFHERGETVERGLRAIFSYRAGDLGLLVTLILLHGADAPTALDPASAGGGAWALPAGLLLLLTASGKAGLPPFSKWLARSTEGPTPSTALFYAGLSVHAGPYLLLRAWSLYGESPVARAALVAAGLFAAASASLHARTRSDIKGAIVMGASAQVGLVVAEIGLGWHALACLHMVANIGLRVWQLLRAPDALHLEHRRAGLADVGPAPARVVPAWLWFWSTEGAIEPLVERWVAGLLRIARALDSLSRRLERLAVGHADRGLR